MGIEMKTTSIYRKHYVNINSSMQIHRIIIIVSVLIVLAILNVHTAKVAGAVEMADEKTVPLPSIELRSIVTEWMTDRGFTFSRLVQQNHRWAYTASKDDITLHITVRSYSPLASVISLAYSQDNTLHQNETKNLWDHIRNYSHDIVIADKQTDPSLPDSIHDHLNSVVCIRGSSNGDSLQFTGFVLDNQRIILTTAHDLEMVKNLTIYLSDGEEVSGTVIRSDFDKDLSLIQIRNTVNSSISVKRSRTLIDNNERVFTIGCPNNSTTEIHSGLIDGSLRKINSSYLWQAQIKTLPGSSGSPAFDENGNLIGIVKGNYRGSDSVGFIITMNTIIDFLQDL